MKKMFFLVLLLWGNLLWADSLEKAKEAFNRDYRSTDYAVRMGAIQKLAETKKLEALKILVRVVLKVEGDQYVYEETIRFIIKNFTSEEDYKYLGSQIASGDPWSVQLTLCRIASEMRHEAVAEGLIKAFNSPRWQVRSAAIFSIRRHRSKKAIPALIERLAKEDGRVKGEVVAALKDLTGADLGDSKEAWKSWWASSGANFTPPSEGSTSSEPRESHLKLGTVLRKGGFYGTVVSQRVVFIIDISGSMLDGTEAGKRIDVAKKELCKVIDTLGDKAHFNVIAYNSRVHPWKKQMVGAGSSNKSSAQSWINSLKLDPNGMTATYDALEFVFKYDKNVDTIYILSDGSPTTGQITGQHQILEKIKELNRFRNLIIHTIAFLAGNSPGEDKESASKFMNDLAKDNSGNFKRIE